MQILRESLVSLAGMLCLGWASVFVVAFIDKYRSGRFPNFGGAGHYRLPKVQAISWWQHLLRLPIYCLGGVAILYMMAVFIPPTYILNRVFKAKI
jgi:hypothetical protein